MRQGRKVQRELKVNSQPCVTWSPLRPSKAPIRYTLPVAPLRCALNSYPSEADRYR